MRIQGEPGDPTVLHLWSLRGQSAETNGEHPGPAVRDILDAFAGPEPGKTFAACLMVSDGVQQLRVMAREHLLDRIAADITVDALTGMLCLEALQFVPDASLSQPAVLKFVEHCTCMVNPSDLAFMLLARIRKRKQ